MTKITNGSNGNNVSGNTYIRSAPAKSPFKELAQKPVLVKMGWNEHKLVDLDNRLQNVLKNFNRITQNRFRFDIAFIPKSSEFESVILMEERAGGLLIVHLDGPPQKVLERAPLSISQELTDYIFETKKLAGDSLRDFTNAVPVKKGLTESGIKGVLDLFIKERKIEISASKVRGLLEVIIETGYEELDGYKMSFFLLNPQPIPKDPVEKSLRDGIKKLMDLAEDIREFEDGMHPWPIVATLALSAVIAEKVGISELEKECKNVLSGDFAHNLAVGEFRSYGLDQAAYSQLKHAITRFHFLYDFLQSLFDLHYETREVIRG